jgi:hypothetical protein
MKADRSPAPACEDADWVTASDDFELAVAPALIVTFQLKSDGSRQRSLSTTLLWKSHARRSRRNSETKVRGQSVLRMMVISYLTGERHLQGLEAALAEAAKKLRWRAVG